MKDNFIKTSILKIKEASKNNKLIVFVGAGVSANSGIPAWGNLIKEMAYDLGYQEENMSSDLYLKIPQYYFNERGEKEYYDKLNQIFLSKKFKVNPIHKEIFKLNPVHIITTNYDTLLEEASIEQGEFFHTVKQNVDLPYGNFNKTIIKMHGDFENKNIVLKEDDYLNYSVNFALIESYIKSLISTNTVLFVGYSVNDPNFNLVFQWVKNILRNHFQPAYLIESNKEYSRIEYSYYKNRGINILYSNEIENIKENKAFENTNKRGNQLYDMLNYFNSLDEFQNISDLEKVYKTIEIYEKLNFIMPDQIAKSFESNDVFYDLYGNKDLIISNENNNLFKVFSKSKDYKGNEKAIFEKIIKILRKANIHAVSSERETIYTIDSTHDYNIEMINAIVKRDSFVDSSTIINFNSFLETDDYNEKLKQAFECNNLGNHQDAYNFYKSISLKAFQDKEYFIYYISEFNRKHVGKILSALNSEVRKKINEEIKLIDLDNIYYNLPSSERESLKYLKDINNFNLIYRTQNKLNSEVNDIKKTKRTIEDGGISFNSAIYKSENIIKNIWMFIETNYLCINNYTEVQSLYISFLNGVFNSYSIKRKASKFFEDMPVQKIETLDLFEIYVMVIKLKTDEVEYILKDNQINYMEISENSFEYLVNLLQHLISNNKSYNNINMNRKNEVQLLNTLLLLSKIKLDEDQTETLLELILNLINHTIKINEINYLNLFIVSVANRNLINKYSIIKLINKYLDIYLKDLENDSFNNKLFSNLILILSNIDKNNEVKLETNIIKNYINVIKNMFEDNEINNLIKIYNEIIIQIIPLISEKQKVIILSYVEKIIGKIEQNDRIINKSEMIFYQMVTIYKFIDSAKNINIAIINDTLEKIRNQNPGEKSYPDPIEENLEIITNLYRNDCIDRKLIEPNINIMKNHSEYFDLYFLVEDINLTDIKLISTLNEKKINEIMSNKSLKNKVYKLLENEIILENDKKVVDKFYIRKYDI